MIDRDTARSLVLMLDNAMPYFDSAASRERSQEAGKVMRSITKQEIAKRARKLLIEAATELDMLDMVQP